MIREGFSEEASQEELRLFLTKAPPGQMICGKSVGADLWENMVGGACGWMDGWMTDRRITDEWMLDG